MKYYQWCSQTFRRREARYFDHWRGQHLEWERGEGRGGGVWRHAPPEKVEIWKFWSATNSIFSILKKTSLIQVYYGYLFVFVAPSKIYLEFGITILMVIPISISLDWDLHYIPSYTPYPRQGKHFILPHASYCPDYFCTVSLFSFMI